MSIPFTVEQFFAVFRAYNEAVWPAQWLLVALGVVALVGPVLRTPAWSRTSYLILAALWAWMALVYHWGFFSAINPLAPAFAALYVAAAALFAWKALRAAAPRLEWRLGARAIVDATLIAYGLILYPLVGRSFGHAYPAAPGFGLPCPTTIFTIGLLGLARPRPERSTLVVPILWSALGATAAISLGVPQDYGLALAGAWAVYRTIRT